HDFARSERLDLKFIVGDLGDPLSEILTSAVERIERLWPARGKAPFQLRRALGNCRRCYGRGSKSDTCRSEKVSSFHGDPPAGILLLLSEHTCLAPAPACHVGKHYRANAKRASA